MSGKTGLSMKKLVEQVQQSTLKGENEVLKDTIDKLQGEASAKDHAVTEAEKKVRDAERTAQEERMNAKRGADEISRLNDRIKALEEELSRTAGVVAELRAKLQSQNQLLGSTAELQEQIEERDQQIAQLQDSLMEMEEELSMETKKAYASASELEEKAKGKSVEIEQRDQTISQLEKDRATKILEIEADRDQRIAELNKIIETKTSNMEKLQKMVEERIEQMGADMQAERANFRTKMEESDAVIAQLRLDLGAKEKEVGLATTENGDLSEQIVLLQEAVKGQNVDSSSLKLENAELAEKVKELEAKRDRLSAEAGKVNPLEGAITELKQKLQAAQGQLEAAGEAAVKQEVAVGQARAAEEAAGRRAREVEDDLAAARREAARLRDNLQKQEQEVVRGQEATSAATGRALKAEAEALGHKEMLTMKESLLDKKAQEEARLRSDVSQLEEDLRAARDDADRAKSEVAGSRRRADEHAHRTRELYDECQKKDAEAEALKARLADGEGEVERSRGAVRRAEEQLAQARDSLRSAEATVKQREDQVRVLMEEGEAHVAHLNGKLAKLSAEVVEKEGKHAELEARLSAREAATARAEADLQRMRQDLQDKNQILVSNLVEVDAQKQKLAASDAAWEKRLAETAAMSEDVAAQLVAKHEAEVLALTTRVREADLYAEEKAAECDKLQRESVFFLQQMKEASTSAEATIDDLRGEIGVRNATIEEGRSVVCNLQVEMSNLRIKQGMLMQENRTYQRIAQEARSVAARPAPSGPAAGPFQVPPHLKEFVAAAAPAPAPAAAGPFSSHSMAPPGVHGSSLTWHEDHLRDHAAFTPGMSSAQNAHPHTTPNHALHSNHAASPYPTVSSADHASPMPGAMGMGGHRSAVPAMPGPYSMVPHPTPTAAADGPTPSVTPGGYPSASAYVDAYMNRSRAILNTTTQPGALHGNSLHASAGLK